MPSTHKTPFLGLNKWLGSDKPKMEDFNTDNQKLDNAIKAHQENQTLHLTPEQQQWVASPLVVGSYQGNAQEERIIELGFTPRFVLVYGEGRSPFEYQTALHHTRMFMGVAGGGDGSLGINIVPNGFWVFQSMTNPPDGTTSTFLNGSGVTYRYLALR